MLSGNNVPFWNRLFGASTLSLTYTDRTDRKSMAKAIPEFEKIFRYRILGFLYSPSRRLYILVRFFPGESIHGGFGLPAERVQPGPTTSSMSHARQTCYRVRCIKSASLKTVCQRGRGRNTGRPLGTTRVAV